MRYVIPIILLLIFSGACERERTIENSMMERAESLMQDHPDSALRLLDSVQPGNLRGKREKARYGLLKTIALHKNDIDTTTFDILQPALDYYPEHGNPDEHFRTLYYQGCIYFNREDFSNAMANYIMAKEVPGITDSITFANLLTFQAELYYKEYRGEDFLSNLRTAIGIYHRRGLKNYEMNSLRRAMDGALASDNKTLADSLVVIYNKIMDDSPETSPIFHSALLKYYSQYNDKPKLREILSELDSIGSPDAIDMDAADSYRVIGEYDKAVALMNKIEPTSRSDSLKYYLILSGAYEDAGNFEEALNGYCEYMNVMMGKHITYFNDSFPFAEKKHELEMARLQEKSRKERIVWMSISGAMALTLMIIFLIYRYRKIRRQRAATQKELEKERSINDNISLEKSNLESEISTNKDLIESLSLEKEKLGEETRKLNEFLTEIECAFNNLRESMEDKVDLINGILAKEMTSNKIHSRRWDELKEIMHTDKNRFLRYSRSIMESVNRNFITTLKSYGLNEAEIDYVSLLCLGLSTKEIGVYLNQSSVYNKSSQIRKKLKVLLNDENLYQQIRKLQFCYPNMDKTADEDKHVPK